MTDCPYCGEPIAEPFTAASGAVVCSETCAEAMDEPAEVAPTEAEIEYAENLARYGKRSADWVAAGEPDDDR